MARKSKLAAVLLLPFGVVFFMIGWALYYFGSKKSKSPIQSSIKAKSQYDVQFGIMGPEERQITVR